MRVSSRLVEYSDSEDDADEETQFREFHKRRSMLRMPRASTRRADEADPPGRDFAFTPRKRHGFGEASPFATASNASARSANRSALSSSSAASPQSPSPTPTPTPTPTPFSFSFSPTPSPMVDVDPDDATTTTHHQQQQMEHASVFASLFTAQQPRSSVAFGNNMPSAAAAAGDEELKPGSFSLGSTPPRANRRVQRQKDLHRTAKRRVSMDTAGASHPPPQTVIPDLVFPSTIRAAKPGVSVNGKTKALSPMDIEMDEHSGTRFTSAFGTSPQQQQSFPAAASTGSDRRRQQTWSPFSTRAAPMDTHENTVSHQSNATTSAFTFGDKRQPTTPPKRPSPFKACSEQGFAFGAGGSFASSANAIQAPNSSVSPFAAKPQQARASSFTFEAAFKEFDLDMKLSMPPPTAEQNAFTFGARETTKNSSTKESLGVRLARRRQAREKQASECFPAPSPAPLRTSSAQKSLFASHNNGTEANGPSTTTDCSSENPFMPKRAAGTAPSASPFASAPKTTNVFQKSASENPSAKATTAPDHSPQNGPSVFGFLSEASRATSFMVGVPASAQSQPRAPIFSFCSTTQPSAASASTPRVENLNNNFDVFSIGASDPLPRRASSKPRPRSKKDAPAATTTTRNTCTGPGEADHLRSPFGSFAGATKKSKGVPFVGTPPADPFVTPIFGQKRSTQGGEPVAKQRLNSLFENESAWKTTNPFQSVNASARAGSQTETQSSEPAPASAQSKTPSSSFAWHPPGAAFVYGRRIAPAKGPTRKKQAIPNDEDHQDTEEEEEEDDASRRGWGEWKMLGGEAYSKKDYQGAADCYLNSVFELEALLGQHSEKKTDQVMKDKAKLHSNRAAALMMLLQIADAQRECFLSIECDPGYSRAYLRLARIQVMLGDGDGAKANVVTAKELLTMDSQRKADANDLANVHKTELAITKLDELKSELKWCLEVHDYSRALAHINEALAIAPSCRALQTQKAEVLFQQKNYAQVIEYCVAVIRKQKTIQRKERSAASSTREPDENEAAMLGVDLSLLRIRSLHCLNKTEEATREVHKLEVAAPSSVKLIQLKRLLHDMKDLKHRANELFKQNEFVQAQELYSKALLLDPEHDEYCAVVYCNRAAARMGLRRYESALQDCHAALRRKPRYPRCLLRRARCNVALKRYGAAVADFERYLAEHPSDASMVAIEREKQTAQVAMEAEARARKERDEQQRRRHTNAKSKHGGRHPHQHPRAWDDSDFYDEFWRSSHTTSGRRGRGVAPPKPKPTNTHYDVLGIQRTATQDEIKRAYRKLALLHHPDKAKDTAHADLFKDMTAAYNVLSDPVARATYDRESPVASYGRSYEY